MTHGATNVQSVGVRSHVSRMGGSTASRTSRAGSGSAPSPPAPGVPAMSGGSVAMKVAAAGASLRGSASSSRSVVTAPWWKSGHMRQRDGSGRAIGALVLSIGTTICASIGGSPAVLIGVAPESRFAIAMR